MKKYVCDNCKLDIKSEIGAKHIRIKIGYDLEDETSSLGNDIVRHYCKTCIEHFEDSKWTFKDTRRK